MLYLETRIRLQILWIRLSPESDRSKAIFGLTQKLLGSLRAASSPGAPSRVINISSIDGIRVPMFDNFAYSASKAAVHMLSQHLANEPNGDWKHGTYTSLHATVLDLFEAAYPAN